MQLKIMSFNVQHFLNYVSRKIDFDLFEKTVRQFDPDILGLNEVYGLGEAPQYNDQARVLAERLGYHWYFAPAIDEEGLGPYGNALLSRYPILNARTILVPDPVHDDPEAWYETRCLLQADIDVPGGLQVNVIHFGLADNEQQNAMDTVVQSVRTHRSVLLGDFNIRPDNPLLQKLEGRMQDTARLFAAPLLSFPSDNPEMKIDYIFTSPDLHILSADIPPVVASDHRPYIALAEI